MHSSTLNRSIRAVAGLTLLLVASSVQAQTELEGVLTARWGDGPLGPNAASRLVYHLSTNDGQEVDLEFTDEQVRAAGGNSVLNGGSVAITLVPDFEDRDFLDDGLRRVATVEIIQAPEPTVLRQSRGALSSVWVTLPCRFNGNPTMQRDLAFFEGQYGTDPPELDHFWRYSSYDQLNLLGSSAENWDDLPSPRSTYVPADADCINGPPANLDLLFDDCVATHDADVNFTDVVGINMMFNDNLDGCAWGGGKFANLDGVSRSFRVTWNPPFSFQNTRVLQHEMGHGFGLPHSNNWDNDGWPYDNAWDVMSGGSAGNDPTYGTIGTDTIAYHKDRLGWLAPSEVLDVTSGSQTVTIDPLNLATTTNLRMVRIPIPDSNRYYTLEARDAVGTYDVGLPDSAVLIHEVDTLRQEDAWLYDEEVPPSGDSRNEGSKWLVGETFTDAANGITVEILSTDVNGGFEVRVTVGDGPMFADGFETGNASQWSD